MTKVYFTETRKATSTTQDPLPLLLNMVVLDKTASPKATEDIYLKMSISLNCYTVPTTSDTYFLTVDPVTAVHPKISDMLHGVSGI